MRLLILISLLFPFTFATSCSNLKTCLDCDSLLDSNGKQACSWCSQSATCVPNSALDCVFGHKIADKEACPIEIPNGYEYNETLARKMILLSFSSYGTTAQTCLKKHSETKDVQVTKQFIVPCDVTDKDKCSGYTAFSTMEKVIIVCFRGTVGDEQLFQEVEYALFKSRVNVNEGGSVCKYFNDAYEAVWHGGMLTEVKRLKRLYPTYDIWVTGHSLGAALAALAANNIVYTNMYPGNRLKTITFGEPRVGDQQFATAHDNRLLYKYRVTHKRDMVPHIPPKVFEDYRHHRYEVWYDNDMEAGAEFALCLAPEDKSCSDKHIIDLSWNDHRHYFGYYIEDFKVTACSV